MAILVRVSVENSGPAGNTGERLVLRTLRARGHDKSRATSGGAKILCAATSMHLRSIANALIANTGIQAEVSTPKRGAMTVVVDETDHRGAQNEWLAGVTAVLLRGLADLAAEYPDELRVETEVLVPSLPPSEN